ncbi:MAG: T9SS type A sorting domain-containing protein [Bacteroidetes bacterium]|jgi:hypothetical protein|nr:T9SS type A sorting domain-containing protein [Bacteroidota bacterium]MBT4401010.1 T9SS type A sorting domain-containing protein [Bacteroidota bacterium]MBT5427122.1 T9SS type A sorting domain-containing protein [Bacteroidota bacterium]MBT7091697.1 T9SS type A sorting domain-containing protein [Bacteroidota bacterium]MBT7466632.1 T9SS type A sorting domain-containing protein [Bacteroidota bacterium]
MKKFTLLLGALSFALMGFSQNLSQTQDAPVKQDIIDFSKTPEKTKAGGDIIWQTSFDWEDPSTELGWSLPEGWEIIDNTDFGIPWIWRKDSTSGYFTSAFIPGGFDTPEDGFLCMPIDEYNYRDVDRTFNESDSYITTPPIDCSNAPSVVVKFNQIWRYCCSGYNLEMLVTNDGGVHWASYDAKFGVSGNTVTPVRYRSPEINISDVAAGMGAVQIRFHIHGPRLYYWMIDDLKLAEAYENDLILEDTWANFNGGFDEHIGHINYWPKSQFGSASEVAGTVGEYSFVGALMNQGMSDQENAHVQVDVLKNGVEVYSDVSDPVDIWTLDRDTLTVNSTFLADDFGDYQFNYTAVSDNAEEIPENNVYSKRFTINDSLFHRPDFSAESTASTSGWVGGNNAGDMVGVGYDLYETVEIKSITAYLSTWYEDANAQFQYVLVKYLPEEDTYVEWLTSEIRDMEEDMARTWLTLELDKDGESEFLEPGLYVACVKMWGEEEGDDDGICGMRIGWDKDDKGNNGYTYMYQAVDDDWAGTGKMNMIGMVIDNHEGPSDAPGTFNVDMNAHIQNGEFYPNSHFVDIAGSFNDWTGSAPMTDPDADGIYSITIENLPVGEKVEYKYRINGNWDTSEFPLGGPNRSYTIRYWNDVDDVYNGGTTTGVEDLRDEEIFDVYPNPTQGQFTVNIVNARFSDLQIKLINLQGQLVYSKTLKAANSHHETINQDLPKGIYFLTLESATEVKTRKIIVR